jgi:hypothetical protein
MVRSRDATILGVLSAKQRGCKPSRWPDRAASYEGLGFEKIEKLSLRSSLWGCHIESFIEAFFCSRRTSVSAQTPTSQPIRHSSDGQALAFAIDG